MRPWRYSKLRPPSNFPSEAVAGLRYRRYVASQPSVAFREQRFPPRVPSPWIVLLDVVTSSPRRLGVDLGGR